MPTAINGLLGDELLGEEGFVESCRKVKIPGYVERYQYDVKITFE